MPTVTEVTQPKVKEPEAAAKPAPAASKPAAQPLPQPQRMLFSDSLLDSFSPDRRRRGAATTFSFVFQCVLLGTLVILPLMFTEALPSAQLLTLLVAPPPPPPPPPPPAAAPIRAAETEILKNGELRTPTRIPKKIEILREDQNLPQTGGVVGGVPGGIPGGQLGGVIGGIISSSNNNTVMIPKLEPVKRVRISQGVTQGMLISKIEPAYPKLALAARVTGVVMLHAIISREGKIEELEVVSGHPILVPAAIEAVKQWRYRPYLLNGEPVEVETNIMVTFEISN